MLDNERARTDLDFCMYIFSFKAECADIVVKLDDFNKEKMSEIMKKFNVVSPVTGNMLSGEFVGSLYNFRRDLLLSYY